MNVENDTTIGTLKKFKETGAYEEGDEIFYVYEVSSIEKKEDIETNFI